MSEASRAAICAGGDFLISSTSSPVSPVSIRGNKTSASSPGSVPSETTEQAKHQLAIEQRASTDPPCLRPTNTLPFITHLRKHLAKNIPRGCMESYPSPCHSLPMLLLC